MSVHKFIILQTISNTVNLSCIEIRSYEMPRFLASLNSDNFLGREIISNLAKAAGLATMISVMRPDIDSKLICHLLIIVKL